MDYILRFSRDVFDGPRTYARGDYKVPEQIGFESAQKLIRRKAAKPIYPVKKAPENKVVVVTESKDVARSDSPSVDGHGGRRGKRTLTLRKRRTTDEDSSLPGSE